MCLTNVADPLTTLASAAIFSAPPPTSTAPLPTSTVVDAAECQPKPETADTQQVVVWLSRDTSRRTSYFYAIRISVSLAVLSEIFIEIDYFF